MVPIAYMPSPIPRQVGWNLFARTIPFASAFPRTLGGSAPASLFSGPAQRSRYSLHARRVALATLCTRGFSSFVASTAALIATGWSEPVPGRVYPRCGPAPSRRTRFGRDPGAIPGRQGRLRPHRETSHHWQRSDSNASLKLQALRSMNPARHGRSFPGERFRANRPESRT